MLVIILFLYGQDFGQLVDDFVKKLVEVLQECDDYDIKIKIICVSSPMLPTVGELNVSLILKKFQDRKN